MMPHIMARVLNTHIGLNIFFCYFGHLYMQHKICTLIVVLNWVSKVDWPLVVEDLLRNNVAMLFVG